MKDPLQNALDKVNGVYKPPLPAPKFPVHLAKLYADGYYISNSRHAKFKDFKHDFPVYTATDVEDYARDYAANLPKPDLAKLRVTISELMFVTRLHQRGDCSATYFLKRVAEVEAVLKEFA